MFKQYCPSSISHYYIPSFLTCPAPPALCKKAPSPDAAARQSWLLRQMPRLPVAQPRRCRKVESWGQGRVRNLAETEQELPRFLPQPMTETGTPGSPYPRNTGNVTPKYIRHSSMWKHQNSIKRCSWSKTHTPLELGVLLIKRRLRRHWTSVRESLPYGHLKKRKMTCQVYL